MESELDRYDYVDIPPIVPEENNDPEEDNDSYSRTHGLSGAALFYAKLFERLAKLDLKAAQKEMSKWNEGDEHIFARFRIWSAGLPNLIPNEQVGPILSSLSVRVLWNDRHQRDLLLVLHSRWNTLPLDACLDLENRILAGPERWGNESEPEYVERRAGSIANRLVWLSNNGCQLNVSVEDELETLRRAAPKWKPEYAAKAVASLESRGVRVRLEIEHSALLQEPLSNILVRAKEISGFTDNFSVEKDPFMGLCASHPVKALAALRFAAKKEEYPEWAWKRFLNSEARKNDKAKLKAFIGETLSRFPPERLASIIHPSSDWLLSASVDLQEDCLEPFGRVVQALIEALKQNPNAGTSGLARGRKPDWANEALNAPTGKIAQAFFNDLRTKNLKKEQGFPKDWIHHVECLLGQAADLRRFALVIFTQNLNWFYFIDPDWTDSNLLSVLQSEDRHDTDAWWSGYLWGASRPPHGKLFQFLKPHLLDKAASDGQKDEDRTVRLAGLILAGWRKYGELGERLVSNKEFRGVLLNSGDRFRSSILWTIEIWSTEQDSDDERWDEILPEFLSDVWPAQKEAKTASSSASLVKLAFSNTAHFPQISDAILPHLVKIDHDRGMLLDFRQSNDTIRRIVDLYPDHALSVLYAVLPDNVSAWPYEMEATLDRIGSAELALKTNKRMIELKRRWNSR